MPVPDRGRVHSELLGDLVDGEQAAGAQPGGVAGEAVVAAVVSDCSGGEVLAGAGAVAVLIESGGDFGVGVIVEEAVERLDRLRAGLALLPGGERDRDRQAGALSAVEADVQLDVLRAVEGDVGDQETGDAFAFTVGGRGIVEEPGEV